MSDAGCRMPFVRCRTRRREGFPAIKRIGRIRRPGRAPPASGPNRRASGGDSTSPRACPCRSTNRRHPPARTLHACPRTPPATVGRRLDVAACLPPAVQRIDGIRRPGRSTPARELHPQPSDANSSSPRACPLPLNESTVSAGPDAPRLPANSTRNRRASTRHRGELPPAIRCIESAARSPTRPVACRSDPQNRSSPRRHGVERRPPASRVPPTAPLARRASRAARAPARRARSGKPPPRNRAHRVDQRARDG
ncbi:Uncharacterised protein [Burkholderia pseudomallei]|nr:Uncharacterised protein [Burkholderia pseudomallei]CAJ3264030.1 Uncharacterised protein [Burkholderia pseudomallei]CAJ3601765.1 Uncharacterised protein [Burkholderia pseudomallei]CAJ3609958.1 Uncharacterised protein [Burkholderia pseudomallei]CAJ3656958.1 Uncharacterised protein [Burkholderia pseudomallei]